MYWYPFSSKARRVDDEGRAALVEEAEAVISNSAVTDTAARDGDDIILLFFDLDHWC